MDYTVRVELNLTALQNYMEIETWNSVRSVEENRCVTLELVRPRNVQTISLEEFVNKQDAKVDLKILSSTSETILRLISLIEVMSHAVWQIWFFPWAQA